MLWNGGTKFELAVKDPCRLALTLDSGGLLWGTNGLGITYPAWTRVAAAKVRSDGWIQDMCLEGEPAGLLMRGMTSMSYWW